MVRLSLHLPKRQGTLEARTTRWHENHSELSMDEPLMPFGKHSGLPLRQVPTRYLVWCLRAYRHLPYALREAMRQELRHRGQPVEPEPAPTPLDWPRILRRWYRQLSLRYHPDRGGSAEAMQAINAAHELLQGLLAEQAGR